MRKIILFAIVVTAFSVYSGCSGQSVGGIFGLPGFIVDPIYYAVTEVDQVKVDLNIRDVYAVVYTDSTGTAIDNSLWVYFVPRNTGLTEIATGSFKPVVALKVLDASTVEAKKLYSIKSNLYQSNFMVWMDVNDGQSAFIGDTIDLKFDKVSTTKGEGVEGKFTSTLHRGDITGLALDFIFDVPVNYVTGTQRTF